MFIEKVQKIQITNAIIWICQCPLFPASLSLHIMDDSVGLQMTRQSQGI